MKQVECVMYYDKDTRGGKHRYQVEGQGVSGSLYLSKIYTGDIPDQIVIRKMEPEKGGYFQDE